MKKKLAILALSVTLLSVPTLSAVDAQEPLAQEQFQTVTDEVYHNKLTTNSLTAAKGYSIGQIASIQGIANREPSSSPKVQFHKHGSPVFASNAPESVRLTSQVNQTLYRDNMNGYFRVWASHYNKTGGNLNFYIYLKNPSSSPVELYRMKEGISTGEITASASAATQQFMKLRYGNKQYPDVIIPAGGSYVIKYGTNLPKGNAANYIGDLRAIRTVDGRDADLKVSDIVTNTSSADLDKIANTATIAPTNHGLNDSDDNYRGLLRYSLRVVVISDLTLDSTTPAKWVAISDGPSMSYTDEQEPLLSRWNVDGEPQDQAEVIGSTGKRPGAFWCTDYEINVNLVNNTGRPNIYTIYGAADGEKDPKRGYINYQVDFDEVKNAHYGAWEGQVISNRTNFMLYTMVQPGLSLPLGLYFVAQ